MKAILNRLFDHDKLSREEAKQILLNISHGQHNHIEVAAFITVFNMRPITLSELQGFRDALLELCVKVDLGGVDSLDIVGTGGDGKNTFNISTTSALVIAGAGYKVTKHGSYGVSSSVGSSNVLMSLGYEFSTDSDTLKSQLDRANICFLHAPLFHPAMKEVVPVRKQMGLKTFFNMLGPLVNPVQPKYQLFGTFSMELSRMYQYIMQHTGRKYAIVYALDGYDEVSLTGDFKLRTNESERMFSPADLSMKQIDPQELFGGNSADEAAQIIRKLLQNEASEAQKNVVVANAGLAIKVISPEKSIEDCMAEARESIEAGKAYTVLKNLVNN